MVPGTTPSANDQALDVSGTEVRAVRPLPSSVSVPSARGARLRAGLCREGQARERLPSGPISKAPHCHETQYRRLFWKAGGISYRVAGGEKKHH